MPTKAELIDDVDAIATSYEALNRVMKDWKQYAMFERRQRIAMQASVVALVAAWDGGQYDKDIWETWLIQKMKPAIDAARAELRAGVPEKLPPEFVRLVIASRIVAFEDTSPEAIKELDRASEAFAECVPWNDEPQKIAL